MASFASTLTKKGLSKRGFVDKVLMMTHLDLQKRFPIYHVCPKCLAALLCGSALRKNVSTSLQELDEVGMTLVDWQRGNFQCELIQHPENP